MADYWKSNPRKFCDVCKCWFADNRSSIEFHERGKRHQEAVRAQLADLARRGRQDHIQKQQLDAEMEQMEKAAMAAFKKDLASNPDLARQYGVKVTKKPGALGPGEFGPTLDGAPVPSEEGPSMDGVPVPEETPAPPPAEPAKKWHEAKSDQGYSYYWNVDTGEAVWEPPDEGYVALPECAPPPPDTVKKEPGAVKQEPGAVKQEPGAVKQEADSDEPPPPAEEVVGPAARPDPYGSRWETVHREPAVPVDLQLPEQHQPKVQPAVPRDKSRIVFRQKTVASLGAGAGETFKKRRVEGDKRRNIRQRTDD
ncbi:WW domain-binding protein 4 [Amphibalanus amphitrite]|uniref:WW domain-binding protein 4 n=1 Tax=Amphibalanus amphitrite TaxID=1232801 RepID=A0A6A4W045_AMPAM|nr:WW domain-binding protein 4 [Amphibalanus amphitrite]